jgi:hypothetical protein
MRQCQFWTKTQYLSQSAVSTVSLQHFNQVSLLKTMTNVIGVHRESWSRQGCGALNEEKIMLSFNRFSKINSQRRNCKCSRLAVFEEDEWKLVCLNIYLGFHRHSHSKFAKRNIYLTGALYPILQININRRSDKGS